MPYFTCPKCKSETLIEKSIIAQCPVCGAALTDDQKQHLREQIELKTDVDDFIDNYKKKYVQNKNRKISCCPKCLSPNLSVRKKGFNARSATAAYIFNIKDPYMWGVMGMNDQICNCLDCGAEFKAAAAVATNPEYLDEIEDFVVSNIAKQSDAEIIREVSDKYDTVLHEDYLHNQRDVYGVERNPGFSWISLAITFGIFFLCFWLVGCVIFQNMKIWQVILVSAILSPFADFLRGYF